MIKAIASTKILTFFTITTLLFTFTACSSQNTTHQMYIQKAKLTKEEQSLIELIGVESIPYILDFSVDDTIQSLQINTYELVNNKWNLLSGGAQQLNKTTGRIAFTFENVGLGLKLAIENEGFNSYETKADFNFKGLSTANSYLINRKTIKYDQEIPLVIQVHTSQNGVSCLLPEYGFYQPQLYKDLGYEKIYAITCLFSQKTVNELSSSLDT